MDCSKRIKKSGKFYRKRKKVLENWAKEDRSTQLKMAATSANEPGPSSSNVHESDSTIESSDEELISYISDRSDSEDSISSFKSDVGIVERDFNADEFKEMTLQECVRHWALKTNQDHQSINLIMRIICKKTDGILPRDARALLHTSRGKTRIESKAGGQYWYCGIRKCLLEFFRKIEKPFAISINVNIDGLPVYKSSRTQFWPILFNIVELPTSKPMPIAIFCGESKPTSLEEFLRPFVNELTDVLKNGVVVNGHQIDVRLRCLICDSPARAFIKGVSSFNSINGCLKCVTEGEYSHISRTVVFTSVDSPLRTDAYFRAKLYGHHHKSPTPLIDIPNLDMIQDIVVGDRLHLIDLGVMKRMLLGWRDGSLGYRTKMTSLEIECMSKMLCEIELPSEIHRKMRRLDSLSHWKGSEFSSFLHYAGVVVLKKFLPEDSFNHFLLLFASITMLSSDKYRLNWLVARKMLNEFISEYIDVYGPQFITSNIHNLQHIVDETEKFGPLNTFSAYPFENALYRMKHLLRSGWKSLEQATKRLSELHFHEYYCEQQITQFPKINLFRNNLRLAVKDGLTLSIKFQDSWFLTYEKQIVCFVTAVDNSTKIIIHGKILRKKKEYFSYPIMSTDLNVFEANVAHLSNEVQQFNVSQIMSKLAAIKCSQNICVFIPLLHTLD